MYVDAYLLDEQADHIQRERADPRRTLASFAVRGTPASRRHVGLARPAADSRVPPRTGALPDQLIDHEEEPMVTDSASPESIHEAVREHYAAAAVRSSAAIAVHRGMNQSVRSCIQRSTGASFRTLPSFASLGCGNPTAVADLHEGERVLDLGSGGGIDVLLSARRVGPTGARSDST
jgi:hypothetical protein